MTKWRTRAVLFAAGLACAGSATGAPKEPSAKPLALKKVEGLSNGRMAYVVGQTVRDGSRFYASNLIVTQPVLVTLKADDPQDEIHLKVTKTQWSKAEREVSTGAAGRVQVAFRTQGEFGLAVAGADVGKGYRMTVWVGDEVKRPMAPVVVPRSKWKSGATGPLAAGVRLSGRAGALVVALIGGLLVVIAGLAFVLLRKKRGA